MPAIRLENAAKTYKSEDKRDKRKHYAVRELSITVEQGEFVFLIGSSGAGKSKTESHTQEALQALHRSPSKPDSAKSQKT